MPENMKTRKEVIGGKKFEFACGSKDCCLGIAENPDGGLTIMNSENGEKLDCSRFDLTRFIAMMNEKAKK
ncbi:MAG: hypothetical protein UR79_C0002G0002 [Candidatus Campbellbacteria bacterium GW2011_GWD1_35_49]|nr:MAG: hypothetical protein UR74_C0002G0331 [Candidatus Campbellbacteria bacterium GW2011_GWD2_35_24]KKP75951.1 MAG: hypothetical protein UR75_C0002G0332 [Candidatus Campbellbacteria bacterium GW2011_GWC2_35_28]KKP76801.1 MAG: hypothetical protein UR76_C0002G0002 [Candidatus Campbellbacteria bacterium GW2011_GWC1_35_31]KKP78727.1 MAG: hypothetical protein UR79_C0002G0002 [Candidatus Campbellbacteria bacterium GW2011_GWD1_35_49]